MMPFRRLFLAALLTMTACRAHEAAQPPPVSDAKPALAAREDPIHLTLIGTNDIHGWVYPHVERLADGTEVEQGGAASFAGYLAILRGKNPEGTLLLDGGDLFQGTLASNLTEGAVVVDVMNALRYDAAAIGNHEFDYGPVGPVSVAQEGMDPFGALKARIEQAKFPLLAVNIYDAQSGNRPRWLPNDGTVIIERKGLKIGILGLVTPSTPTTTNPVNVASLRFGSLIPETVDAAKRLRERGADVIIVVAHAGSKCKPGSNPRDAAQCDATGEIIELLQGIPAGTVDAVIAGHTHAPMGHFINGTPVIETWGMGLYFGTIDLYIDAKRKKVIDDRTAISPVVAICTKVDETTNSCDARSMQERSRVKMVPATFMGAPVVRDQAMVEMLAPALARVEAEQHRKLGIRVPNALSRNYESESPLGDVLADAMREMEGADIVFLNPGGLRADLPAGELIYGSLYEVLPFDNTIATLTLTGDELKRLLAAAYSARKGVFQESGLKVKLGQCPSASRLKNATLTDGRSIVPEKKYKVVMPDFLARGGDGLAPVVSGLPANRVDLGMARGLNFRDALVEFWAKKKAPLIAPKPGRLAFSDDGTTCTAGQNLDLHSAHRGTNSAPANEKEPSPPR